MNTKLIAIIVLSSMGLYCLFFTKSATKLLSLFHQAIERLKGIKIEPKESIARPIFIRLVGVTQLFMAALFYFGNGGA
jgi:hypothetical protein